MPGKVEKRKNQFESIVNFTIVFLLKISDNSLFLAGIVVVVTAAALALKEENFSLSRFLSRCMPGCIHLCQEKNISEENINSTSEEGKTASSLSSTQKASSSNTGAYSPKVSPRSTTVVTSSLWDHIYWKRPVTLLEDILTMGNCLAGGGSSGNFIENPDGDEKEFHSRYIEDRVLGEGEFGVVKLVHDMREPDESKNTMACKTLRKGVVFKANTLYAPLKPEVLQGEVQMLRTLAGKHFCMSLTGVYETSRVILLVTELCAGGEMMEYLAKQEEDLQTDDVSRIAFQMLDAINHCARNDIIHRDIKPENVMFKEPTPGSDLRLIDFGSGTNKTVEGMHTTFAGSAFYISPEMFQHTYTQKTDVWSVGVTLYVLVAGYPADVLQKAFNKLQSSNRNLKDLPNMPENLPDSFYDMMEGLLVYRHKKRKSAGEMLTHEFVEFHKGSFSLEQIAMQAQEMPEQSPANGTTSRKSRTMSVTVKGSVGRHALFLDYQKYQRSLTTLLATLLDKKELAHLFKVMTDRLEGDEGVEIGPGMAPKMGRKLDVIKMRTLMDILKKQRQDQVLAMITKLPGSSTYDSYAYEVSLLKEFIQDDSEQESKDPKTLTASLHGNAGRKKRRSVGGMRGSLHALGGSLRGKALFSKKNRSDELSGSVHAIGSFRGRSKSVGKNMMA